MPNRKEKNNRSTDHLFRFISWCSEKIANFSVFHCPSNNGNYDCSRSQPALHHFQCIRFFRGIVLYIYIYLYIYKDEFTFLFDYFLKDNANCAEIIHRQIVRVLLLTEMALRFWEDSINPTDEELYLSLYNWFVIRLMCLPVNFTRFPSEAWSVNCKLRY